MRHSAESKAQMRLLFDSGLSTVRISELLSVPQPTAWYTLNKMGVKRRPSSVYLRGRKLSEEHVKKVAAARIGRKHSEQARRKMSAIAKARGELHNWHVDGKGKERDTKRKAEMDRLEYRLWRESVFERDEYSCACCGEKGGELNADHILPWASHPDRRYDVENGRTLCVACHKATPSYGRHAQAEVAAY